MRDIVATIQPDQDDLVRAELDTSLCIQGAPGTGKTAVGLHRAAYLLYTYPERLRRSGVLVVGPNNAFLHYIAQVLPALGEGGIEQTTVDELVGRVPVRASEDAAVATLKGDARMADVLRRAVLSHVAKPTERRPRDRRGTRRYRVAEHRLRRYVDDARRALDDGSMVDRPRTVAATARRGRPPATGGLRRRADRRRDGRSRPIAGGAGVRRYGLAGPRRSVPARSPVRRARVPPALLGHHVERRRASGVGLAVGAAVGAVGALDRRGRGARRRAGRAARRHRRLRPRRRGRGAGPVGHAVPGDRPALPAGFRDRARRPGPGHDAVGARIVGDHPPAPRSARGRRPPAHRRLPGAGRGAGCGEPAPAAHRPRRATHNVRARGRARPDLSAPGPARGRGAGLPRDRGVGRRHRPRRPRRRRPAPIGSRRSGSRRAGRRHRRARYRRAGDQREGPGVRLGGAARTGRHRGR